MMKAKRLKRPDGRGWYRYSDTPPTANGCTVEPIRKLKDIQRISRSLKDRPRDYALWILGINTGFRAGDLLQLTWDQLLTPQGQIVQNLPLRESKTGNHRRLPLGDGVRVALQGLLVSIGGPDAIDSTAAVFAGPSGKPITVQRLHQMLNEWTAAIGLVGNYGSHTFRKTFGYWLHEKGAPVVEIQAIFGHSSPSITSRYIGIDQARSDRRVMELDLG